MSEELFVKKLDVDALDEDDLDLEPGTIFAGLLISFDPEMSEDEVVEFAKAFHENMLTFFENHQEYKLDGFDLQACGGAPASRSGELN